jgi:hypothetical protein
MIAEAARQSRNFSTEDAERKDRIENRIKTGTNEDLKDLVQALLAFLIEQAAN